MGYNKSLKMGFGCEGRSVLIMYYATILQLAIYMTDHKKDPSMLSPQNNLRNSFKPSGLTNGLKSMQNLHTVIHKPEQKKVTSPGHPLTSTNFTKTNKQRPESPKVQKTPITAKKLEPKAMPLTKKFSAQIDPKNISSPRKEDSAFMKSPDQKTTKNVTSPHAKQDLRTTFTPTSFTPKNFDAKQGLRKTTLAPNRLLEVRVNEFEKGKYQIDTKSPKCQVKKQTFEKRFQTAHTDFIPKQQFNRTPSTISHKREPVNTVCGFVIIKSVGSGKFGEVLMARHATLGFLCALKKFVKAKVLESNTLNQIVQEIKLQAFINNPNIVQYYGCVSDADSIYLILEYMEGGTLFDHLNGKEKLSELETATSIREITMAVKCLHDLNIAHRDIKPENIVLNYGVAKLCDFGWSARVQGSRKTYCGTFDYAPPEILERKQYDLSVDLWCVGVLAYELMTGRMPFQHEERKIVMQKIVNVDKDNLIFPPEMTAEAKDFIQNLVKKNPNERMKSYKLLNHPFLDRPDVKKIGNN